MNIKDHLSQAVDSPPEDTVQQSKERVNVWFSETAPVMYWERIDTLLGQLVILASEEGVCRLDFSGDVERLLAKLEPKARAEQGGSIMKMVKEQFRAYFAGDQKGFNLPLDYRYITPFQRTVLAVAANIPAGGVLTYHQVAKMLKQPKASRAVGQALARNPIPIILPCHRVIASDGSLRGYAGGLERKRKLLTLEGVLVDGDSVPQML